MKKLFLLLFFLSFAASLRATELNVVTALDFALPTVSIGATTLDTGSSARFGGGVIANFTVMPSTLTPDFATLETGLFYMPRGSVSTNAGVQTESTFTMIQIPLSARFNAFKYLSFAAGTYIAFAVGNVSQTTGGGTTQNSYDALNFNKIDWGVLINAGTKIPLTPSLSLVGQVQYLQGFLNQDATVGNAFRFRAFQFLLGAGIEI